MTSFRLQEKWRRYLRGSFFAYEEQKGAVATLGLRRGTEVCTSMSKLLLGVGCRSHCCLTVFWEGGDMSCPLGKAVGARHRVNREDCEMKKGDIWGQWGVGEADREGLGQSGQLWEHQES